MGSPHVRRYVYRGGRDTFGVKLGAMSFNMNVTVREGKPEVTISGTAPDGQFIVTGHDDEHLSSLSVTRQTLDNRYVQVAQSTAYKEK